MTDEADITADNSEFFDRINRYKSHKQTIETHPTGYCLFCEEPVPEKYRWCNADCRDDWQRETE